MAFEDNQKLLAIFEEIADFLELQGENIFKVKAYQKAARGLEGLERSVTDLYRSGELQSMPGFGKALVEKVGQFVATGQVELHQSLKASFPPEILHLMDIPGLGAKKASVLYRELKIGSVDALEAALRAGLVRDLKGFGQRTEEKLLDGIAQLRQGEQRWLLGRAQKLADHLLTQLRALPAVKCAEAAGSLRRGKETVGDLDLLVITADAAPVMDAFTAMVEPAHVLMKGPTKSSLRWEGRFQVDLRCVEESSFGAAMQYFTGSKDHNVVLRGRAERLSCKLNEYGLFDCLGQSLAGTDEEGIYAGLGLPWIAPELRESGQEIEWAEQGRLPIRLQPEHLHGNLHTHSLWSDGEDTLEQLAAEAMRRGYEYLAVTDHSRSMVVANGLTIERLLDQGRQIERLNDTFEGKFRLLWGSECDILGDGSLDFPEDILAQLDFVVVAVHSQFQMPPEAMTERICKAMGHPHVDVLAHPSGRILGKRAGYQADWEAIYATAREHNVALEINCSTHRLDLSDLAARRAHDCGCWLSLGTDAHSLPEFDNLHLGVLQARRAGIDASRLLNGLRWEQLQARC
ncbi:DNA polymerase/3'-5' exonuclease PolX [bacterium]|nr:DNA polymerase/3'-5' exonuclease PolX [bacterium]